ncbi:MAG TPA: DNRLRE domain-containing protein, partial [Bacteroidia bacterium]|nr:DNRLRE domain-containing protein [Bacteroidia bacterium]
MKTIRQILAVTLLAFSQVFGQQVLTFEADADAALSMSINTDPTAVNTNYGTSTQNAAYHLPGQFQTWSYFNRSLIHFDLSSIPANSVISSATIDLYALGVSGAVNGHSTVANSAWLRRAFAAWDVNTVTWNTQPPITHPGGVVLPSSTNPLQDYLGVDVTEMVRFMVANPSQNFGFK